MTYVLFQIGAFFAWFVYGSFFEWVFHKYLFHSPKIIPATYKAHALTHHGMYSGDDSYDLPNPEDPGGKHIMMDWFALPLFLGFHFPIIWGVQRLTGIPSIWGGLAAIAAYYVCYESIHFVMHVPRDRWIERTRVFRFLNEHHRLHHKNDATNLNVVFPLADITLRTLRTHKMRKVLAKPQESPGAEQAIPQPKPTTRRSRA
jgi:hypothetical protein